MARRREMVATEHLPYLRKVAWLSSQKTSVVNTGQYIDTGLKPSDYGGLTYQEGVILTDSYCCASFGSSNYDNSNRNYFFNEPYSKIWMCWGSRSKYDSVSDVLTIDETKVWDIVVTIKNNNVSAYVDGTSKYNNTSASCDFPSFNTWLFNINFGNTISGGSRKGNKTTLSYFKIYDGDTILRDYIPVVALFDGTEEGCMYDRVSKQLFRNAGTGAFTWGELSASANGGGYKLKCPRRSYRRSSRPSARFCALPRWEVAA